MSELSSRNTVFYFFIFQLIAFIHTLLTNKELKKTFQKCLVVCPLNTVLNWQFEWKKWLDKKDQLPVSQMYLCSILYTFIRIV